MRSAWLIAEREFRTYVATLSFWVALAIGPLAAGIGLTLAQTAHRPPAPVAIEIVSADAALAGAVQKALVAAASLEGRPFTFGPSKVQVMVNPKTPSALELEFTSGFPLSATGRALLARTMERDAARRGLATDPLTVRDIAPAEGSRKPGPQAIARFLLMMMLWLTLTGSLGMLLQTVVRERATRALESLLAAASPGEIMAGKLAGVGAVSLLILAAWLGSIAALAWLRPGTGIGPAVLAELASPALLLRAAIIYLLAYAFYGSITVALGGMARDSASAQNLARPMFIVLVLAFFAALAFATGSVAPASWLLYIPVLTPFLLLLIPAVAMPLWLLLLLLGQLALSSLLAARFAAGRIALSENGAGLFAKAG